jgi:hypothetical protein
VTSPGSPRFVRPMALIMLKTGSVPSEDMRRSARSPVCGVLRPLYEADAITRGCSACSTSRWSTKAP